MICCANHEIYIRIDVVDYPSANGVHMLRFSSYCFRKLQSLDQMVYGLFKKYYNSECDDWMFNHHEIIITMHNIPQIVGHTFPKAITPTNIQAVQEYELTLQ